MSACHNCGLPPGTLTNPGLTIQVASKLEYGQKRARKASVWVCCRECAVQALGQAKYGLATSKWPVTLAQFRSTLILPTPKGGGFSGEPTVAVAHNALFDIRARALFTPAANALAQPPTVVQVWGRATNQFQNFPTAEFLPHQIHDFVFHHLLQYGAILNSEVMTTLLITSAAARLNASAISSATACPFASGHATTISSCTNFVSLALCFGRT